VAGAQHGLKRLIGVGPRYQPEQPLCLANSAQLKAHIGASHQHMVAEYLFE